MRSCCAKCGAGPGGSLWRSRSARSGRCFTDSNFAAPGKPLTTFRAEASGKDDDSFTSVTENQIVVKAVAGKDLVVSAKAKDAVDVAYEWKRKESMAEVRDELAVCVGKDDLIYAIGGFGGKNNEPLRSV